MLPPKLNHWLQRNNLPPRLLISGSGNLLSLGKQVASELLAEDLNTLSSGLNPDVKICADDNQSLKIGDTQNPDEMTVRGLIKWLHQTPISSHRVLILENINRTSRDAMQAWLKVLEEPPARAQFILTTKNHYQLPTTILSRVTVLPISHDETSQESTTEAQIFLESQDTITRFRIIEALDKSHKEDPKGTTQFMDELLHVARKDLKYQALLPLLFETYRDIQRNVNRRLTLEHLALQLQNH